MDFKRILAGEERTQHTQSLEEVITAALGDESNPLVKQKAQKAQAALVKYVSSSPTQAPIKGKDALAAVTDLCTSIAMQKNFEQTQAKAKHSPATAEIGEKSETAVSFRRNGHTFASDKTPVDIQAEATRTAKNLFAEYEQSIGKTSEPVR